MAVEIILLSISAKVWDLGETELATPGSAARQVTNCTHCPLNRIHFSSRIMYTKFFLSHSHS